MTAIQNFFQNLLYQIPKIGISDIIDILVVSFLIYTVLRLVRSSSMTPAATTSSGQSSPRGDAAKESLRNSCIS